MASYGGNAVRHAYHDFTIYATTEHTTSTNNGTGYDLSAYNYVAMRLSVVKNTTKVGSVIVQWSNDNTNWSKKGQLTADPTTTAHAATILECTIGGRYARIQCTNFDSSYQILVEAFCRT